MNSSLKLGMGHPLGPLALADLIGLDTTLAIADVLYEAMQTRVQSAAAVASHGGSGLAWTQKRGGEFFEYRRS